MHGATVELQLTTDDRTREQLVALLAQLGVEGFWEEDSTLRCYLRAERWTPAFRSALEEVIDMVYRASGSTRPVVTAREMPDTNWNADWEKTIRPVRVTDRILIRPSWHAPAGAPGECEIIIDPKMSFGTGYHESTRLSLRLLERYVRTGRPMLDVGTGTGILAIAAVKLGASGAVGVDVDPWSIENAAENAAVNDVGTAVRIIAGDLREAPHGPFATICANIQRDVLESMLPGLEERLDHDGVLLLAGLLLVDAAPMRAAAARAGLRVTHDLTEHEWTALVCMR